MQTLLVTVNSIKVITKHAVFVDHNNIVSLHVNQIKKRKKKKKENKYKKKPNKAMEILHIRIQYVL